MVYQSKVIIYLTLFIILTACCPNQRFIEIERTTIDSSISAINIDTVYFETEPKIIYRQDTLILTPPFETIIDTVIEMDTIRIRYTFPENSSTVTFRERADTVYTKIKTIKKTEIIREEITYAEIGVYVLIGLIIGGLIVFLKMKFGKNSNAGNIVIQNNK